MATATALWPAQMVAAKVELDICVSRMVGALYAKLSDFLVLVF